MEIRIPLVGSGTTKAQVHVLLEGNSPSLGGFSKCLVKPDRGLSYADRPAVEVVGWDGNTGKAKFTFGWRINEGCMDVLHEGKQTLMATLTREGNALVVFAGEGNVGERSTREEF